MNSKFLHFIYMRLGTRAGRFSATVKPSCWLVDSRRGRDFVRLERDTGPWQESHRQGSVQGAAVSGCLDECLDEHTPVRTADRGQGFRRPSRPCGGCAWRALVVVLKSRNGDLGTPAVPTAAGKCGVLQPRASLTRD